MHYVSQYGYLVWTDDDRAAAALAATTPDGTAIQFQTDYEVEQALSPHLDRAATDAAPVDLNVQLYNAGVETQRDIASIERHANLLAPPRFALGDRYVNLRISIPGRAIALIAGLETVVNIEPHRPPRLYGETQDQIIAGNLTASGAAPTGPGYLTWLGTRGFPTTPSAYPIVAVVDDGVDDGTTTPFNSEFYAFNDPNQASRIVFAVTPPGAAINNPHGPNGHGNLNASIVAGYNAGFGPAVENLLGFNYGLGVVPYGRIGYVRVFTPTFDAGNGNGSIVEDYHTRGARISSNSWGSDGPGVYDITAQAYDGLSRDARLGLVGNHEILFIFAAGNEGPFPTSIGSPATACGDLSGSLPGSAIGSVHQATITGLDALTDYFFAVEVTDTAGNTTLDDNGGDCFVFSTLEPADYFTQLFGPAAFDLDNRSLTLTPDGSANFYSACISPASSLPTDPGGGNVLDLAGAGTASVAITGTGGDSETTSLQESPAGSGIFVGSLQTSSAPVATGDGVLQITSGQVVSATYMDADDGSGNPATRVITARTPCTDHFMLYRAKVSRDGSAFYKFGRLTLADDLGESAYHVVRPITRALAADKNGEGINDANTHLQEYKLKAAAGAPRFAKVSDIRVISQCGDLHVQAIRPISLLAPAHVDATMSVPPPDAGDHAVDHFVCYRAKQLRKLVDGTRVEGLTKGTQAQVSDGFQARYYDLKRVTKLCLPVDKSGAPTYLAGPDKGLPKVVEPSPIRNPDDRLVCYKAALAKDVMPQDGCGPLAGDDGIEIEPRQETHAQLDSVHVSDRLGLGRRDTVREIELCVPSLRLP